MATLPQKLFIRVLQLWGLDFTRMKDTKQLQAEGKLPKDVKQVGHFGTIVIVLVFLVPMLIFIGTVAHSAYTFFKRFYG